MNNQQENNYFLPVLSALAGIGAIVTAISPIFLNANFIGNIFIDASITFFASLVALIVTVLGIWFTSSVMSYRTIPFESTSKWLINSALAFIVTSTFFYSFKLIAQNGLLNEDFASTLQLFSYFIAYFSLSIILGLLLREGFQQYKHQRSQIERLDRIRETLIKAGILNVDLIILSVVQDMQNTYAGLIGTYELNVIANKRKFFVRLSQDLNTVIFTEELKNGQVQTEKT